MEVIEGAGRYTAATGGEPNHWAEHLASTDLSVGTYSIPAGGLDDQAELGHLLVVADDVALHRRGEAALRGQAQLVQRHVACGLVDPQLERVLFLLQPTGDWWSARQCFMGDLQHIPVAHKQTVLDQCMRQRRQRGGSAAD